MRIKWKEPVSNGAYIDRYQLQLKEYTAFDLKEEGDGDVVYKPVIYTRNSTEKISAKKSSKHVNDDKTQVNFTY